MAYFVVAAVWVDWWSDVGSQFEVPALTAGWPVLAALPASRSHAWLPDVGEDMVQRLGALADAVGAAVEVAGAPDNHTVIVLHIT